jgi:hypothetical protein
LETPVLDPLQTARIDIISDAAINTDAMFILGIPEGQPGTLLGDGIDPGNPHIMIASPEMEPVVPGFSSWIIFYADGLNPIPPGLLLNNVTFRCDGPGNVNMLLIGTEDFSEWLQYDNQMIIQTPEPATIALLGLGAILLKRRR